MINGAASEAGLLQLVSMTEQASSPAPVAARLEGTAIRIHPRNSLSQECYSGGDEKAGNAKLLLSTEGKKSTADSYIRCGNGKFAWNTGKVLTTSVRCLQYQV